MSSKKEEANKKAAEAKAAEISVAKKKAQIIQGLLDEGKKMGMLEYKTVADKLEELELEADQMDRIYEIIE